LTDVCEPCASADEAARVVRQDGRVCVLTLHPEVRTYCVLWLQNVFSCGVLVVKQCVGGKAVAWALAYTIAY